jgi:hypothetical protein
MLLSVFRRRFDKSFEYRVAKANCNNSMGRPTDCIMGVNRVGVKVIYSVNLHTYFQIFFH